MVWLDLGLNPSLPGLWRTLYWAISLTSRDRGSIPGRVIPKIQKMVLDASLLSTQHYKVRIKSKVEQSRELSGALRYTSVWQLLKREPSGDPRLKSPTHEILAVNFVVMLFKNPWHDLVYLFNGIVTPC